MLLTHIYVISPNFPFFQYKLPINSCPLFNTPQSGCYLRTTSLKASCPYFHNQLFHLPFTFSTLKHYNVITSLTKEFHCISRIAGSAKIYSYHPYFLFIILHAANLPIAAAVGSPPGPINHWLAKNTLSIPFTTPGTVILFACLVVTKLMYAPL